MTDTATVEVWTAGPKGDMMGVEDVIDIVEKEAGIHEEYLVYPLTIEIVEVLMADSDVVAQEVPILRPTDNWRTLVEETRDQDQDLGLD